MTQRDLDLKSQQPRKLLTEIRTLIEEARRQTAVAVNIGLTLLYWRIGRRIHREVLGGERAAYGEEIVVTLSRQLNWSHFSALLPLSLSVSLSNVNFMRGSAAWRAAIK